MKRIITLLFICMAFASFGQTKIQGTIRQGSSPNSVIISWKPTADITTQITNVVFALQIPNSVNPMPTATIVNNFFPADFSAWNQDEKDEGDGFYTFRFATVPVNVTSSWTGSTEYDILEIKLDNGSLATTDVRLSHLANGGSDGNSAFYVENNDPTNTVLSDWESLFYGAGANNTPSTDGSTSSYITISGIALPTKFMSFYAFKQGATANLTWTVAEDENNDHFEVQRSIDGRSFTSIATVGASKNDKLSNTYSSTDNLSALSGRSADVYYRIRQVEKDGTGSYSVVRTISLDKNSVTVLLMPNPVVNSAKLIINAETAGKAVIMIYDQNGKQVQQISILLQKGINQQDVQVSSLASGAYTITVKGDNNLNQTVKLIKGGR